MGKKAGDENMQTLITEQKNGVGWIRFHRPDVRNAVNLQMMQELEEVLAKWKSDSDVKVLVFTGDERAFVSGGDLTEFHRLKTADAIYPVHARMGRLLDVLERLGKPTIAAVGGAAVGGGCEIAVSCDFRFASDNAQFGFIQAGLGITTGWGGGSRLIRLVGRGRALALLLTGERIDSTQAFQYGLVDRVVPSEQLEEEVQRFAETIARTPLPVIEAYMELANRVRDGADPQELTEWESRTCSRLWESDEHHRAVEIFLRRTGRL
jgi:3-hydroxypropionyl-coenzyme A dehydratase